MLSAKLARAFGNLALIGVSAVVGLAICEGLARLVAPLPLAAFPQLYNGDYTYEPHQRERHVTLEWDHEIRINADGFREDTLLADIPRGSSVFLGDSFIEGYGVALSDTAAKKLQRIRAADGRGGTVINAGHNNTSPNNYFSVWKRYFSHRPEVATVIVGFFIGNDLIEALDEGRLQSGRMETYDAYNLRDYVRLFLNKYSMLYSLTNYTIKANRSVHNVCRRLGMCGAPYPDDIYLKQRVDPRLPPTIERIAGLADAARSAGQRTLIVIIPAKDQVSDDGWRLIEGFYAQQKPERFYANNSVAAGLRARCVEVLDLTAPIVEHTRSGGVPLYFRTDGHWSPAGHEFAARMIDQALRAPPPPCAAANAAGRS